MNLFPSSLSVFVMARYIALIIFLLSFSSCFADKIDVVVDNMAHIAQTDDTYICATIDWWPSGKCDYNQCPWENTSILNLDLNNPLLSKSLKEFNPIRIRLGGSMQDQVVYGTGHGAKECPNFKNSTTGLFGFSEGCLPMERWDQLHDVLHNKSRAKLTFGLNALIGRKKVTEDGLWAGPWNPANARDFMKHIISKGQDMDSYELGNELSANGVSARVEGKQYGHDMIVLKKLVTRLYKDHKNPPKVLSPGGFFEKKWFQDMLQAAGPNNIDGVSHHIYNLGPGDDPNLIHKIQDPYVLSHIVQTFSDVKTVINKFGPWASAWISESGGAYNSGGKTVSHSFVDSFWYLDQLGMASTYDHKVYCRQALIGGNYGLLNTTTMVPNPDYYSALLWHRLMGKNVLATHHSGSPYLRAYVHCAKNRHGITALLINLSNSTSFEVNIVEDDNLYPGKVVKVGETAESSLPREEYHLTPQNGDLHATTMLLNGEPLVLNKTSDIPPLNPKLVDSSSPIKIKPSSIAFVNIKDFKAPPC